MSAQIMIDEQKSTLTNSFLGELRPFSMAIPGTRDITIISSDRVILSFNTETTRNQLTWER